MENYLRKFWVYLDKNQTVKGLFLIGVVLLGGFGVWEGLRLGLNTEFPVLVVSSGSMIPTLQIGDLIVIRGQDPSTIKAGAPPIGSIIVFRPPCCSLSLNDPNYLVVHRVVEITPNGHFVTRGDNNGGVYDPWDPQSGGPGVPPANVVGVYQSTIPIPYLGSTILSIRGFMYDDTTGQPRPEGIAIIAVLVIALFAIDVVSPSKKDKKPPPSAPTSTLGEPPQNAVNRELGTDSRL